MLKERQKKRVLILLPTLPHYRLGFFKELNNRIDSQYELLILNGASNKKGKLIHQAPSNGFVSQELKSFLFSFFGFRIVWIKGLLRAIRKYHPDAVVILFNYGVLSYWLAVLLCKVKNKPLAFWSSGHKRKEIYGRKLKLKEWVTGHLLNAATAHICYGTRYAQELKATMIEPESIFIAQNTINVERILSARFENKEFFRTRLALDPDETVFLFVGVLIKNKNLDIAIKTLKNIIEKGYRIKFLIIGSGEQRKTLQALVKELGIESSIVFLGSKFGEELTPYFLAADAFLLPGTGGLAINEAMAYGIPVISTVGDGTGLDLIDDGKTGYLLQNSLNNLENCLLRFLSLSPEEQRTMSINSKETIKKKATLKNMVDGFIAAIDYMLNAKQS